MNRSMIQASVTMGQIQHKLDIIGHNLANTNTPGYKSRQADFSSLLLQQIDNLSDEGINEAANLDTANQGAANQEAANQNAGPYRLTPDGIRSGAGARLAHTNIDLSQGNLQKTDRSLDVALLEDHHLFQLQVTTENGLETNYTRSGNFYLNPLNNGQMLLTNADGLPVLGEDGEPIQFADNIDGMHIRKDGAILINRNGIEAVEAQLGIVEAIRPRMLEAAGNNRFRLPDNADIVGDGIIANADGQVQSGTIEVSNVDTSKQMTDMLMAQRAYQFNARSISTSDQMMGLISQLRS
ncbi:flagellar hook-basal body protein [Halobacillus shinanisalinarum]|uniref:Flagellar hook-basal body protein n=1 Tax=Halobacillus shinanisalinarum TaxID=2932258 RepID=A0ABY4H408_9BACI|nr:flagellar hook-basal body protein [Halobacillus shinanisalinarum]UOQ94941.1 flagellar hook-basal body protein [Halobacillus shinanisalinarum]